MAGVVGITVRGVYDAWRKMELDWAFSVGGYESNNYRKCMDLLRVCWYEIARENDCNPEDMVLLITGQKVPYKTFLGEASLEAFNLFIDCLIEVSNSYGKEA